MKKVSLLFALLITSLIRADVLLWQVNSEITDSATGEGIDYSYAKIMQTAGTSASSGVAMANKVGDFADDVYAIDPTTFNYATVGAVLGAGSTESYFYIELYDAQNNVVGQSQVVHYDDMSNFITSAVDLSVNFGNMNKWGGGTFSAVPEPTSGLLFLVGAALVGLRRRKVVA